MPEFSHCVLCCAFRVCSLACTLAGNCWPLTGRPGPTTWRSSLQPRWGRGAKNLSVVDCSAGCSSNSVRCGGVQDHLSKLWLHCVRVRTQLSSNATDRQWPSNLLQWHHLRPMKLYSAWLFFWKQMKQEMHSRETVLIQIRKLVASVAFEVPMAEAAELLSLVLILSVSDDIRHMWWASIQHACCRKAGPSKSSQVTSREWVEWCWCCVDCASVPFFVTLSNMLPEGTSLQGIDARAVPSSLAMLMPCTSKRKIFYWTSQLQVPKPKEPSKAAPKAPSRFFFRLLGHVWFRVMVQGNSDKSRCSATAGWSRALVRLFLQRSNA